MIRLLFEQSGTFKNQFKQLGYNAIDIDIENKFNETDLQIDIFQLIDEDRISELIPPNTRLVMCFFPCVRFSTQFNLIINCKNYGMEKWDKLRKIIYSKERERERSRNYERLCKIIIHCITYNIPLIVENPSTQNYLLKTLPIEPVIIHNDRTKLGDNFKKPTMYYFINFRNDFLFCEIRAINNKGKTTQKIIQTKPGISRSIISSEYAREFILNYIDGNI